jgi:hypothetical protein
MGYGSPLQPPSTGALLENLQVVLFYLYMNAEYLQTKLKHGLMESNILLGQAKLLDNSSRDTPAFNDPHYFPFYYHLGTQCSPKNVLQIGAKLGLIGSCFMQSCKTVEMWVAMDDYDVHPPANLIRSNLRMFSEASIKFMLLDQSILNPEHDHYYKADMGFLTEKYDSERTMKCLDFFWKCLRTEGPLVVDYIHDEAVGKAFHEFCRVRNREPICFETRYGLGIVTR